MNWGKVRLSAMQFLMIETSGPDSLVALFNEDSLRVEPVSSSKPSQTLLSSIETLLERETIDFLAIGTGPGAFIGTRVGVMTAKTLAFARKLPIVSFCSLKRYTPDTVGPFTLSCDAKSMGTFVLEGIRTCDSASFQSPYVTKEKLPPSKAINLPFLRDYILKKFSAGSWISVEKVDVFYPKIS